MICNKKKKFIIFTVYQCQNWFPKFSSGNFNVEGAQRSRRPDKAAIDNIMTLIDANRQIRTSEVAERKKLYRIQVFMTT